MLEVETFSSITSPPPTTSTPRAVRRTRLSSVPLVNLRAFDEKHNVGEISSRKNPSGVGTRTWNTGHITLYPRSRGGMCSVSDTMENLKIVGSSPLPSRSRIKHLKRNTDGVSRFPKLDQCAHFHYENIEIGQITARLCDKRPNNNKMVPLSTDSPDKENEVSRLWFYVEITSNEKTWMIRRNYENFRMLDKQLHRCVYDRKFSILQELPVVENIIEDELTEEVCIFYCHEIASVSYVVTL
ncbi:rho GTPase-activating protein 32-like [Tachypleus tridentatus]|uniref:rho GTPase-activating protein 32-like n=1 Tax=Tachypleus tridentatus TaxID=6853 RepID=UPI003FCFDB06